VQGIGAAQRELAPVERTRYLNSAIVGVDVSD
jgi:hypothetical protein